MDYDAAAAELEQVWRAHVIEEPRAQLARWRDRERDIEVRLSIPTPASQLVLISVCKRYGLRLYRLPRQHRSTMCVQARSGFIHEVLHPLLSGMAQIFEEAAHQTTLRVIDRWSERRADEAS